MDKEHIIGLSKKRAQAAIAVEALGRQNTSGLTPEEDLASRARYRLAQDALDKAEADYRAAIKDLSTDELAELAG
jgi:hypothetical protein